MAEEPLQVDLVAADHRVWSGEASMVVARTTDGDIGILPGHAPLLGVLVNGAVRIAVEGDENIAAAVHGGFVSVADNRVAILAEAAELADEIDVERARSALEEARQMSEDDADEAQAIIARNEARIRVHDGTAL